MATPWRATVHQNQTTTTTVITTCLIPIMADEVLDFAALNFGGVLARPAPPLHPHDIHASQRRPSSKKSIAQGCCAVSCAVVPTALPERKCFSSNFSISDKLAKNSDDNELGRPSHKKSLPTNNVRNCRRSQQNLALRLQAHQHWAQHQTTLHLR